MTTTLSADMSADMPSLPTRATLLTSAELAGFLRLTTERLYELRVAGTGPAFVKIGRDVRYAWPDVRTWLASNTHTTIRRDGA